jgi:hypothetical protein
LVTGWLTAASRCVAACCVGVTVAAVFGAGDPDGLGAALGLVLGAAVELGEPTRSVTAFVAAPASCLTGSRVAAVVAAVEPDGLRRVVATVAGLAFAGALVGLLPVATAASDVLLPCAAAVSDVLLLGAVGAADALLVGPVAVSDVLVPVAAALDALVLGAAAVDGPLLGAGGALEGLSSLVTGWVTAPSSCPAGCFLATGVDSAATAATGQHRAISRAVATTARTHQR